MWNSEELSLADLSTLWQAFDYVVLFSQAYSLFLPHWPRNHTQKSWNIIHEYNLLTIGVKEGEKEWEIETLNYLFLQIQNSFGKYARFVASYIMKIISCVFIVEKFSWMIFILETNEKAHDFSYAKNFEIHCFFYFPKWSFSTRSTNCT